MTSPGPFPSFQYCMLTNAGNGSGDQAMALDDSCIIFIIVARGGRYNQTECKLHNRFVLPQVACRY